ncbi:hypothetical protein DZG01_11060 [Pseudomonas fluorescens]|nr:hypothetical protein DZG01_11060 [Pseudomonas fluorescens]
MWFEGCNRTLWRGDLSPLGCAAAPKPGNSVCQEDWVHCFRAATQPNGDKSPRHGFCMACKGWA